MGQGQPTTNVWVNAGAYLIGLIVLFLADEIFRNEFTVVVLSLASVVAVIAFYDLRVAKVHHRASTGLGPVTGAFNWPRIAVKLLAFYATIGAIAVIYWAVPYAYSFVLANSLWPPFQALWPALFGSEFKTGILTGPQTLYEMGKFGGFFYLAERALPWVLVLIVPYTAFVDQRMRDPRDGAWHVGQLLLGRWRGRDIAAMRTYALGWTIKAFFLPVMAAAFLTVADRLISTSFGFYFRSVPNFYFFLFQVVLFVDLSIAVLGYLFTTRVLDAHIRSVNPFLWGWMITLVCYYPFWRVLYNNVLAYGDGENWVDWLGGNIYILIPWAAAILFFKLSWMWANITFGLRFSNLTHRGIMTTGAFAVTKHPSYLSKNIAWWLINMPFLSLAGPGEAVMNSICLVGINLIYVARARAEEQHLSEDPAYVAYALKMNENGLFARITKAVPRLAYRAPELARA